MKALGLTSVDRDTLAQKAIQFANLFMSGEVGSFNQPLENSPVLQEFSLVDRNLHERLIGVLQTYAHADCHALTVALSDRFPEAKTMKIVDQSGIPLHSYISGPKTGLCLDANGIHDCENLLKQWLLMNGNEPVSLQPTTPDELMFFSGFEDEELEEALVEFGYCASFMIDHLQALTDQPTTQLDPANLKGLEF